MIKKKIVTILQLTFFFSLLYIYSSYIVVLYGYRGFDNNFSIYNVFYSVILIMISVIMTGKPDTVSFFFLNFIITFIIVPSLVIFSGSSLPLNFILITISSFIIIAATVYLIRIPQIEITTISNRKLLIFLSLASFIYIGVLIMLSYKYLNFSILKVYLFRREAAASIPGIFGYLSPVFGKIIVPFAIIIAVLNRRWGLMTLLAGCSVLIFALTSHKAPLFYPLVILFLMWISKFKKFLYYWLFCIIAVILTSFADFYLLMDVGNESFGLLGSLFARRVFIVPSFLNYLYFDFFSGHEYYYWSGSKITFNLFSRPYDLNIPFRIGEFYFGNPDTSANTGWIGSGIAQAGLIGCYVYSILIGLVISFLNSCSKKIGVPLVITFSLIPIWPIITSTDLLSAMLTHGLLLALFLISIINPRYVSIEED